MVDGLHMLRFENGVVPRSRKRGPLRITMNYGTGVTITMT